MAISGSYTSGSTFCYPGEGPAPTPSGQSDCVYDTWLPVNEGNPNSPIDDGDWIDYYHGEFHGFAAVLITSPASNLTVDTYYSTEGWFTASSNSGNYNSGALREEDVYEGNKALDSALLQKTVNTYTLSPNSCHGSLDATYNPCEIMVLSGVSTPDAGWPTKSKSYSDCANQSSTAITSYQGYDAYGNPVASVDGVATANSSLYSSNGCTLSSAPSIFPNGWSQSHYTGCTSYDSYLAQPGTITNALNQSSSLSYDYTQGALPTSAADPNNQITTTAYSYGTNSATNGKRIVQVSEPGETGSYTNESYSKSTCNSGSTSLAQEQFGYDTNLRPTQATATWLSGSGTSGTIYSQSLGYDAASNITSSTTTQAVISGANNSGGSETEIYCYDEQNRLIWAGNSDTPQGSSNGTCGTGTPSNSLTGASYSNQYTYTHLGQLWQGPYNGNGSYQYLYCNSSQPHQLTGLYPTGTTCSTIGSKTQTYGASYDSWGNLTTRTASGGGGTTASLSYDGQDQLLRWNDTKNSTNEEWYLYDASGQRVLRRSQTGTGTSNTTYTLTAFGLEDHIYDGGGTNLNNKYYYALAGRLIGFNNGNPNFLFTDALGSVVSSITNTANSVSVKGNQVYGPYIHWLIEPAWKMNLDDFMQLLQNITGWQKCF